MYLGSRKAAEHAFEGYLESEFKLQVNRDKSAVARASTRDFLGYGLIGRATARLKVAAASGARLRQKVKALLREKRGAGLAAITQALNPLLRGWTSYFRHAEVKNVSQDLDGWLRRKLRCQVWRYCKRPAARFKTLMKQGLTRERAWRSATNGRGAWWNSGASHMNAAFPKSFFDRMGLVSLVDTHQRFQRHS